ncbi:hypothetical protein ACNQGB_07960 [Flavobacterium sp. XS1P32]|uniref:hypothetical protein n=1 Tax=Flavobacterium sp. XS1P32 TaxID=3401726 RepID=UPI003AAA2E65
MKNLKKVILVLGFIFIFGFCYGQKSYLKADGTLEDDFFREQFVGYFNETPALNKNVKLDIDNKYLVIISKYDCGDEKFEPVTMQKSALNYSYAQLLSGINLFKTIGHRKFTDNYKFEGIIFKTNTICMFSTRSYDFKFSIDELKSLPEYVDFQDLIGVIAKNDYKNIIYAKNNL